MNALPVDLIVKASALLAAAALVDVAMRRRASAATKHLVWSMAITALLVLPVASFALPKWQVRIPVPRVATALAQNPATTTSLPVSAHAPSTADAPDTPPTAVPTRSRVSALRAGVLLGVVYGLGIALLLARLILEPFALRRLTRASVRVTDPAWRELLQDAARRLRVDRPVTLLQSGREVMPLTFGTLRPVIVLPASAGTWAEDRRRAVLLHELAHVARCDCFVQRLTAVASAIYWPHPGVWWAGRRQRVERELACDDRVLAAGAPAREYAGHLLDLAHSLGRAPAPATALGMARMAQLEHRLLAILDAARNRAALRRGGRNLTMAAAAAVFLPMASLRASIVSVDASPAAVLTSAATAVLGQDFTGTWEVRQARDPKMIQATVHTATGSHGRTMTLAQLEAMLGEVRKSSPNAPETLPTNATGTFNFPLRREAGTFTIDGIYRNGVCAGTFSFAPDPAYAEMLAKRGIGRPTPAQQFALAIADVGTAYLDALAAAGYAKPDVEALARAAQHGVDIGYVRDMAALDYRLGTVDRLTLLRDHGVDPEYVRGMAANGIAKLSADELVRTRDHGVDPAYIRGLADLGYRGLSVEALVGARDHGVDPEYIRGMQGFGYHQTLDDLTRTRDHGVDPAYVRDMAALGYKGVPLDALIRMRDHGVDPAYVRRLQQGGVSSLSVDDIIRRRDRGGEL